MRRCIISLFLLSLALSNTALAQSSPALSPAWLKLYQYKNKSERYVTNSLSPHFFFTGNVNATPEEEFSAAVDAFAKNARGFGSLKLPAGCAFPARFVVAKKLLNAKWPEPACPELNDWLTRLNADRVSVGYASAYTGNPASVMGHTYLRLSNSAQESEREALGLLSYAVGFLAQPHKEYSQLRYFYKGVTGGFKGAYDIEPFYIKVGLYNNSESRDLFEQTLNFTKDEVDLFLKYLWELIFNAEFKYYFFDENCSYRILTAIEAVRPQLELKSKNALVVLPAETVRELIEKNVAAEPTIFRSSVRRRLNNRLEQMTSRQKKDLKVLRKNSAAIDEATDVAVLDTLMEEWKYRNYRAKTLLKNEERQMMEKVFSQRAKIETPSEPTLTDAQIAAKYSLIPPYKSHKPGALRLGGSHFNRNGMSRDEAAATLTYNFGAHLEWQNPQGYFDASAIEYLTFDFAYGTDSNKWIEQNVRWAHAKAIEPLTLFEKNWSWQFTFEKTRDCLLCASAGAGGAVQFGRFTSYFMPIAAAINYGDDNFANSLAGGVEAGIKYVTPRSLLNITYQQLYARKEYMHTFDLSARYLKYDWPLFSFRNESSSLGEFKSQLGLSFVFD